jgi:hypothetical protein
MRKHVLRRPILTGFLLAALAAGPLSGGTNTGKQPPAKDWVIIVGPGACNLNEGGQPCDTQTIQRGKHKIVWKSNPAGQILGIIVHVPSTCPQPFTKMTQIGTDPQGNVLYAVNCHSGQCNSGPAVNGACTQTYLYDQILVNETCYGIIIIRP